MRIAILCSSLEPGRDGVGDYSTLLAGGLVDASADCRLIALHDPHLSQPREGETQGAGGSAPTLRLPAQMPWPDRAALATKFLDPLSPEWVSLQFVSYGWHRRGFVHGWGPRFDHLAGPAARHLMVHEVWKGESLGAPLKWRLLATLQRALIIRMLRAWHPTVVHTHAPVYAAMMESIGLRPKLLSLFSGVPIEPSDEGWLTRTLAPHGIEVTTANRSAFMFGGFFASLHPEWEPEPIFSTLRSVAADLGRRVVLISAGHMRGGEARWASLPSLYPDFTFVDLGSLPTTEVSQFLQAMDFAIATTSWKQMPKSSAAAAMLDHGLPVIVTRDDWRWSRGPNPDPPFHPRLILADQSLGDRWRNGLPREKPRSRLPDVAAKLISDLGGA